MNFSGRFLRSDLGSPCWLSPRLIKRKRALATQGAYPRFRLPRSAREVSLTSWPPGIGGPSAPLTDRRAKALDLPAFPEGHRFYHRCLYHHGRENEGGGVCLHPFSCHGLVGFQAGFVHGQKGEGEKAFSAGEAP